MEKCYAILFKNFQHRKVKKEGRTPYPTCFYKVCAITGPVHGKNYFTISILGQKICN